ncbi:hypothetical protein AB4Z32_06250 [Massilia sp. 2TAF26]|uniref:hypothetical protein n=1 Tax=Massilia sp. 2TAF26 TaxID=3233012 RepID=UPI003F9715CA
MITHPPHNMIKLLDNILPASLRADTSQWQAARNLTVLAAVTAVSVPLLTTMYHLLGFDAVGMVVLTAGVVMMVTPFTLAAGLPIAAARDLFVGALFLLKVWMAVYLGGLAAPTTPWFVLCPAVAMLLGGLRPALLWSALVSVVLVGLFMLDRSGAIGAPPTGPAATVLHLASVIGLMALVVLILALATGAAAVERRHK